MNHSKWPYRERIGYGKVSLLIFSIKITLPQVVEWGDSILLLIPTTSAPLEAQFQPVLLVFQPAWFLNNESPNTYL